MSKEQEVRLERRPEARSFTVERLLLAVRDGKIRIPEFTSRPKMFVNFASESFSARFAVMAMVT